MGSHDTALIQPSHLISYFQSTFALEVVHTLGVGLWDDHLAYWLMILFSHGEKEGIGLAPYLCLDQ